MSKVKNSRRDFLKTAGLVTAGITLVPRSVISGQGKDSTRRLIISMKQLKQSLTML